MPTENSAPASPQPVSLKNDGDVLVIVWSDGKTHRLAWRRLRENCPCASCRARREQPPEQTQLLPVLKPEEAAPIQPTAMKPMGNYAYGIEFSDGHNTGIFAIEFLRELGERFLHGS